MDDATLTMPNDGRYTFLAPLPPAGSWQIGGAFGLRFPVAKRPRWLTRRLAAWLLEWEWIEEEPARAIGWP